MQTVQHTKHFAHPANWAGFLLVGSNVRLSNKVAMGHELPAKFRALGNIGDILIRTGSHEVRIILIFVREKIKK